MNKLLKFLGVWNIIFGSLFIISIFFAIPGLLLMISGILFLNYNKLPQEELSKKKGSILFWAILFALINIVSSIFAFVIYDKLNDLEKNKDLNTNQDNNSFIVNEKTDPEIKKTDIMLKLGVILVVLSGFIIATSNWNTIANEIKVLLLFLLSGLFYGLSYISETKLKLKKSEIMYFTLTMLFINFGLIAIGYFGILGEYLSFEGEGNTLYISLIFLTMSLQLYIAYKKYFKQFLVYLGYIGITFFEIFLLLYFKLDYSTILLINSIIIFFSTFNKSESLTMKRISKYLSYFVYFITLSTAIYASFISIALAFDSTLFETNNIINSEYSIKIMFISLTYLITTTYMYYKSLKDSNKTMLIFIPIIFIFNSFFVLSMFFKAEFNVENYIYSFLAINTIAILIAILNKEKKELFLSTFITSNILLVLTYASSFVINNYLPIIIALVLLVINSVISMSKSELKYLNVEKYLQPVKIVMLTLSLFIYFRTKINIFNSYDFISISALIIFLVYFVQKNKALKYIYYLSATILCILYVLFALTNLNFIFKLINIIVLFFITYISFKNEDVKYNKIKYILYVLTGFAFYNFVDFTAANYNLIIPCNLILIFMLMILSSIYILNKKLSTINILLILLPYFSIVNYLPISFVYKSILINFGFICLILGITRFILTNILIKTKNILEIIFISLAYISIIFNSEIACGIYIGITGLIAILIGSKARKIYSLFYLGIVFTILNLIIQFKNLWEKIPFPIYLLIVGLILIGVVMYREFKKKKIDSLESPKEVKEFEYFDNKYQAQMVITILITIILLILNFLYLSLKSIEINKINEKKFLNEFTNKIKEDNKNIDFNKVKITFNMENENIKNANISIYKDYKVSLKKIVEKIKNNNQASIITVYRVSSINNNNQDYYEYLKSYEYGINMNTKLKFGLISNVEYFGIMDSDYGTNTSVDFDEYNESSVKIKVYKNSLFDPGKDSIECDPIDFNDQGYEYPDFKYIKNSNHLEINFHDPSRCHIIYDYNKIEDNENNLELESNQL